MPPRYSFFGTLQIPPLRSSTAVPDLIQALEPVVLAHGGDRVVEMDPLQGNPILEQISREPGFFPIHPPRRRAQAFVRTRAGVAD